LAFLPPPGIEGEKMLHLITLLCSRGICGASTVPVLCPVPLYLHQMILSRFIQQLKTHAIQTANVAFACLL